MAARLPRLKEFVFRYEAPIDQLKTQLHRFLSSFPGLKLLSVLLEWTYDIPDPSCFLNTHAQTLEVLVYEARACPRMTFEQDTSVPIGLSMGSLGGLYSPLYTILTSCPTLQELSVPMSWDSLSPYAMTDALPGEIFYLSTLHLRNLPPGPTPVPCRTKKLSHSSNLGWKRF